MMEGICREDIASKQAEATLTVAPPKVERDQSLGVDVAVGPRAPSGATGAVGRGAVGVARRDIDAKLK
jgi:hypothetical protein